MQETWVQSPGVGNGNSLHCSCWENSMDGRAWWVKVHRVAKSQTWLSIHAQEWNLCFPWSYASPAAQTCWPLKSDSLGIPSPFVRSSGWEAWCGAHNLRNSGRASLVLLFSSVWFVQLAGIGFAFIVIAPLLPAHGSFSFDVGHGNLFFFFLVGSSILLSMTAQQLVVILALSQEKINVHPFTLPSWTSLLLDSNCK